MHQLSPYQSAFVLIQGLLLLALVVRVWSAGLYKVYPCFFGYLLANLLQFTVLPFIPYQSHPYRYFWVGTEGVVLCFYALVVAELYQVVLRELPGIASVSRRYLRAAFIIAVLVSLLLLRLEETPNNVVSIFLVIERAVSVAVVLVILLMAAFLVYYPVPINRNVMVYFIGYSVYFLIKATALFIRTLGHYILHELANVLMVVFSGCLLLWIIGLTRRGELRKVVLGHKWNLQEEEQILAKLREINSSLLGASKKY
jgi:hypothetical protein